MIRRKTSLRLALATLLSAALAAGHASAQALPEEVTLRAADGVRIVGTYYPPDRPGPRPSIILLHMLNRARGDWDEFARSLSGEGYAVLAIDLRGHGESTRGVGSWRSFTDEGFQAMVEDVAAAHGYLREASEADGDRLAVVGASIGANVALLYGSREPSVKTLALLSPGLDYRGVRTREPMIQYGSRPVLIAASREDSYSAESSAALDALASGRHRLVLFDQAGHGTRMFDKAPRLGPILLDWLASTL